MIEHTTYRVLHLAGVFFLLFSLSSLIILSRNQITRGKTLFSAVHGISLFVIILGGFGLLARLEIVHGSDWPVWVWAKLIIWLIMGISVYYIKKYPDYSNYFWILIPFLAIFAAYLAVNKPL